MYLGESFRNSELTIEFRGWHEGNGRILSELPPGVRLRFPTRLASSDVPILPILVHGSSGPSGMAAMVLMFEVAGAGEELNFHLTVDLPKVVIFELDTPDRVVAFQDRPTVLPVTIRNSGNTAGRARLSFSGLPATAPSLMVGPGRSAVAHVELPPLANGERSFTITVSGGITPVRTLVFVRAPSSAPGDRHGLMATLAAQASGLLRGESLVPETTFSLSVRGQLSRLTYLEVVATADGNDLERFPEHRLLVRYRGTTLELDNRTRSSPTGSVGRALYLSQRFTEVPVVDAITLGAALPLGQETATPRFGVLLDGPRLHTQVALDIAADDIAAEARVNFAPFHATLRYADSGAVRWRGRINYSARSFGANILGEISDSGSNRLSLVARYGTAVTGVGPATFSVRLDLRELSFSAAIFRISLGASRLGLLASGESLKLEAQHGFTLGNASVRLAGSLPLTGSGEALAMLGATLPAGPLLLDLRGSWTSDGTLDVGAGTGYTALLGSGSISGEVSVDGRDLLNESRIGVRALAAYAGGNGLGARLGVSAPLHGPGGAEVTGGLSYSAFLPTPGGLAQFLDGPDPTVRRVLVRLTAGDTGRPVRAARLLGCGTPVDTGADGLATLRGPAGPCRITVDPATLPLGTVLSEPEYLALPGETLVIDVLPTSTLRGEVRYRDAETGEVLQSGPAREVRVLVQGPVERWTTVVLPNGRFEMRGLPVGDYSVRLPASNESVAVELRPEPTDVLLTTPAPRRRVLDPAAVTPPVRLDLGSLLATPDEPIRITAQSPSRISRIVVELAGHQAVVEPEAASDAGGPWRLELPLPPVPPGATNLEVTVEFAGGQVAQRVLQLVVVGPPVRADDRAQGTQPWQARAAEPSEPAEPQDAMAELEPERAESPDPELSTEEAVTTSRPENGPAADESADQSAAGPDDEERVTGEEQAEEPARDRVAPDRAAGQRLDENAATRADNMPAADSIGRPLAIHGLDPDSFALLPGSDELISFRAPSAVVPPGVTLALYVSSQKPIERVRVTNLRHLHSFSEIELAGQSLQRVLTISPIDAAGVVVVPVEVRFTDGTVENRTVTLELDRYAPIPIIPGHNVPLSPPLE